jgi:hypothetical protein
MKLGPFSQQDRTTAKARRREEEMGHIALGLELFSSHLRAFAVDLLERDIR